MAAKLSRNSPCCKRNFFSSSAWHFSIIEIPPFNLAILAAYLAFAAQSDETRAPSQLARLECFETLEAPEGNGVPAQLIQSSGFTAEST